MARREARAVAGGLNRTIHALRSCTDAHSRVIAQMERYAGLVYGDARAGSESDCGYRYGYSAELRYLNDRKVALDALIHSVEDYRSVIGPALAVTQGVLSSL